MWIRSLGHRTALTFARFEGEVLDRGGYVVVRTPRNPTFRWGNYLLFDSPPGPGDVERWSALFERELADLPEALRHRAFTWDDPSGAQGLIAPFVENGYLVEHALVLVASEVVPPPRPARSAQLRALRSDDDWAQATANQVACGESGEDEAGYRRFKERQMRSYRDMVRAGKGAWFGAFEGARLVADLGLFVEAGLGRFQQVCTAPGERRRGLCGTLVHAAAREGLESLGAERLVLVAEEGGAAARIYASLGFEPSERLTEIQKVDVNGGGFGSD